MNNNYILLSNILNEKFFSRHPFFNPNRIKQRAAKQRELLDQQREKQVPLKTPVQPPQGSL